MKQYIDKAVIKSELERIEYETNYEPFTDNVLGKRFVCRSLLSFIDTLEVKEIDLEKEVIDWWNAHYSSKAYTFEGYTGHYVENSTLIEIAKYFFELGLKTKGE